MWGHLDDDRYAGLPGFATLPELAKNFPFGRNLPSATFPADFVKCYASLADEDPVNYDDEVTFFIGHFKDGPVLCWYDGLFSPQMIHTQNQIIFANMSGEPNALEPDSPHHRYYAIGSAYAETTELRMLVCLAENSENYGKIYVWHMQWHETGQADVTTTGFGFVANSLGEMFKLLQIKKKAAAQSFKLNNRN